MDREEQKEARRLQILEVALDQFIRRGYAGTKIADIAKAADISVGLLFHYYDSKEALYLELIKLGVQGPENMIQGIGEMEPLRFFETCASLVLRYANESEFTCKMFVLMSKAAYSEGIPEEAKKIAITLNFYDEMVPLIVAGQKIGTIREGNPQALSIAFWKSLQGSIEVHALDKNLPLPEASWIVDIIKKK